MLFYIKYIRIRNRPERIYKYNKKQKYFILNYLNSENINILIKNGLYILLNRVSYICQQKFVLYNNIKAGAL